MVAGFGDPTVSNSQREMLLAPASADCVDIAGAHAAALDFDVNIVIAKRLGLELILVEFEPCLRSLDLESSEFVRVRHGGGMLSGET
jgi:type IV secretory pathway TrbD component